MAYFVAHIWVRGVGEACGAHEKIWQFLMMSGWIDCGKLMKL